MHLLLIAFIGITTTQPGILDQTDEELTAPGYYIAEDICIDPFIYISNMSNDPKNIACQAFFVDTEQGEKWRIIMVGSNRLVVLQEDMEIPLEVSLPFEAWGATYSRGGRFVIVRGGTGDRSIDQALYFDVANNITRIIDPSPDEHQCRLLLSDTGRIIAYKSGCFFIYDEYLNYTGYVKYDDMNFRFTTSSYTDNIIVTENVIDRPREILAFDWDGNLLWECDTGDRTVVTQLAVSQDGSIVVVPFTEHGIMVIDGNTGSLFWEYFDGMQTSTVAISPDNSYMSIPIPTEIGELPNNFMVAGTSGDFNGNIQCQPSSRWHFLYPDFINDHRYVLFHTQDINNPQTIRRCLLAPNGALVWSSEPVNSGDLSFIPSANSFNNDYNLIGYPIALSSIEPRFVYQAEDGIHIVSIHSGEE